MKSICEMEKRNYLYFSLLDSYIYSSTTNTVLHGKTLLHIKFVPTKRFQSYHKKTSLCKHYTV